MKKEMTPKERAIEALNLRIPDEVPTFELEFQLEDKMFGKRFVGDDLSKENIAGLSEKEKEVKIHELVDYMVHVYTELEYCIVPAYSPFCTWDDKEKGVLSKDYKLFLKLLKEGIGNRAFLGSHGDGTFAIPDGNKMYDFVYNIADDPDGVKKLAKKNVEHATNRNNSLKEAGIDVSLLCSDYCYNSGPFISPQMFREFIQPYLYENIKKCKEAGLYVIKHTDGNIMPIIDQLVECEPHALHSIDPMAGVDIREVKKLYGDKVARLG